MNSLLAVVLVCSATIPLPDCDKSNASDIIATPSGSLPECFLSGQAAAASAGLPGIGRYMKIRCELRDRFAGARP